MSEARTALRHWANVARDRDRLVHLTHVSGLSVREISRLTGLSRLTISKILAKTNMEAGSE